MMFEQGRCMNGPPSRSCANEYFVARQKNGATPVAALALIRFSGTDGLGRGLRSRPTSEILLKESDFLLIRPAIPGHLLIQILDEEACLLLQHPAEQALLFLLGCVRRYQFPQDCDYLFSIESLSRLAEFFEPLAQEVRFQPSDSSRSKLSQEVGLLWARDSTAA